METLLTLAIYLPALASLVGVVTVTLLARKNMTIWILVQLAVATLIYYLFEAQAIDPRAPLDPSALATLAIPFVSPSVLAFLVIFLWKVYNEKQLPWYQYIWFVPPIAIGFTAVLLYWFMGETAITEYREVFDRLRIFPPQFETQPIYQMMFFIQNPCYKFVASIYAIWIIGFSIVALRRSGCTMQAFCGFLFKKASLPPMHFLLLWFILLIGANAVSIILGRYYLFNHAALNGTLSIIQTICLTGIILSAFGLDYVECTLRQILFIDRKEDLKEVAINEEKEIEEDEAIIEQEENEEMDEPIDNEAFRQVQERIEVGLKEIMEEKHTFLNCELRMVDVARMLCTNRNYLSRHINEKYGVNFNEYINRMRIEYSKQYMLDNPNQLLDTIAVECGFSTAQSFGRKFKAMEYMTPRTWLVRNLHRR